MIKRIRRSLTAKIFYIMQEANRSLQTDIEQERLLEQKRLEFFSAVSHELKTPVTIIKGQMEGMIHQVFP